MLSTCSLLPHASTDTCSSDGPHLAAKRDCTWSCLGCKSTMKCESCVVVNMQAAALVISWSATGKNLEMAPRIICTHMHQVQIYPCHSHGVDCACIQSCTETCLGLCFSCFKSCLQQSVLRLRNNLMCIINEDKCKQSRPTQRPIINGSLWKGLMHVTPPGCKQCLPASL